MSYSAESLYRLLPSIYRLRDEDHGDVLKMLLAIIAEQIGAVEKDIDGLYNNWFIETCDEWVVPYIGDLLGVQGLHPISGTGFTQRARVANTLRYRRRKGTATMLEQLARDTTLWNTRAVEFFKLLSTTQYINHIRLDNLRTPHLRYINELELLDTPFDTIAHTADVRRIATNRGKHNIPNVGLFLWRLQNYAIINVTPRAVASPADGRFRFTSIGYDATLFNQPQTEETITHLAEETNVPDVIRPLAFYLDLKEYGELYSSIAESKRPDSSIYYGPNASLDITKDGLAVLPLDVMCMDLRNWARPPKGKVGVDVRLGRLAFHEKDKPQNVAVSFNYGFSGDIGGGPYDRRLVPQPGQPAPSDYENTVAVPDGLGVLLEISATRFSTISEALNHWEVELGHPRAVINIADNRTYEEDLTINMAANDLVIQADNLKRPTLIGNVTVQGGGVSGRLTFNGLLISGSITVAKSAQPKDSLGQLDLVHSTLVPGGALDGDGQPLESDEPSVTVNSPNGGLRVNINHSITGPLRLPVEMVDLKIQDSIVESPVRGKPAKIQPALVSGTLVSFPILTSARPELSVTIGNEGPYTAAFTTKPKTLAVARGRLQEAIRKAHDSPAFVGTRVIIARNRLIVLPGMSEAVTIELTESDRETANELCLSRSKGKQMYALISGVLSPFPGLGSATPRLTVAVGDEVHPIVLGTVPTTLAEARTVLEKTVRGASAAPAFKDAIVGSIFGDFQLVVLPGTAGTALRFGRTAPDSTTLTELALESDRPAIAANQTGEQPGPPTTLERTTVLGQVHVKELTLASEVIFANRVAADRRQIGCVRFSYIPDGSRTPRRYRCQPDLEIGVQIAEAAEQARALHKQLSAVAQDSIRQHILRWLVPALTSTQYGHPAYGQLSLTSPLQIRMGGEDGSEMGAFSYLKQPQREANLRASLDAYLRFGLEAGIFYPT